MSEREPNPNRAAFLELREDLFENPPDRFVAFVRGELQEHGEDLEELVREINTRFPGEGVYIVSLEDPVDLDLERPLDILDSNEEDTP